MSDIPIFFFVVKYALPVLNFRWNKIFVAFCVNTSFNFLFFQMLSPKICFSCTYCTNTLCFMPQMMIVDQFTSTSKGLFVLYVATVNWIVWHFLMIVILIWSLNFIFNKMAFFLLMFFYASFSSAVSSLNHTPGRAGLSKYMVGLAFLWWLHQFLQCLSFQ